MSKYILASGLLALSTANIAATPDSYVVGGIDSVDNELPWQLYLESNFIGASGACGAVYIGNHYALTAAHCLVEPQLGDLIDAYIWGGDIDRSTFNDSTAIRVVSYTVHPSYRPGKAEAGFDIALLRLEVSPKDAQPIRIATADEQDEMERLLDLDFSLNGGKENLLVSGWGMTDGADDSSTAQWLQQTLVSGMPDDICRQVYREKFNLELTDVGVVCAIQHSPNYDRSACSGDSGGPLVWQNPSHINDSDFGLRLVGLVSFGEKVCDASLPSVFTETAYFQEFVDRYISGALPAGDDEFNFKHNPFDADYEDAGKVDGDGGVDIGGDGPGTIVPDVGLSGSSISFLVGFILLILSAGRRRGF